MSVEVVQDVMDVARANAVLTALGRSECLAAGDALLPFFHQLHFWDPQPADALGRDGHPAVGAGLIPDMGLPRRMWAGGRLAFHAPLLASVPAERRSFRESVRETEGRSGPLAFVTLRHEIWQGGTLKVTDWQDLVYREDARPGAPAPATRQAPDHEAHRRAVSFDTTLLFRYSALTFNGHRIHYDLEYARQVEGYGGLVVHGPLLAQHLMLFAHDVLGGVAEFSFRAQAPLLHFETAELCLAGDEMWVRAGDGRLCMSATVRSE